MGCKQNAPRFTNLVDFPTHDLFDFLMAVRDDGVHEVSSVFSGAGLVPLSAGVQLAVHAQRRSSGSVLVESALIRTGVALHMILNAERPPFSLPNFFSTSANESW